MNHELLDQVKHLRLSVWIRKFSRKERINLFRSTELVLRIKIANGMSMRKSALLELIGIAITQTLSKATLFNIL
jgi:hypothetical protein